MRIDGSNLLMIAYFILLWAGIMVPSDGSHGLFSLKSLAFLGAFFAFAAHLVLHPRLNKTSQILLVFTSFSLIALLISLGIGITSLASAIDQFKLFIITLFIPLITLYMIDHKILKPKQFFRFVIFTSFLFSLLKLLLVVLHILNVINLLAIMEKLGIRFMSMAIYGNIGRMQTSVDILTPFILYFALMHKSLNFPLSKWFLRLFIVVSWFGILLSFSRYLILAGVFAHFAYWMTLDRKKLLLALSRFMVVIISLVLLAGPERVYKVVEKRFFSEQSEKSDDTRVIQIQSLMVGFFEAPLFGKGLGGFTEDTVRDNQLKHSYEVQWVAFLMQFGLVGMTALFAPILIIYLKLLKPPLTLVEVSLAFMFTLWLLSGFTNPFLISLSSGIIYALFITAPFNFRNQPAII